MTDTTITDPELLNRYAAEATSTKAEVAPRPTMPTPSDTEVILPGGALIPGEPDPIRIAEVRELTGFDEEKMARIPAASVGKLLSTILELGTVSVGDHEATPALLDSLLVGDREALLLGIRIATYGKEMELTLTCPRCQTEMGAKLDLTADIPVRKLEDQSERVFQVELSSGKVATVSMPTGREQKSLLTALDKTTPEMNTLLLAGCVRTLDGKPLLGTGDLLRMGMRDRGALVKAVADRRIGPQFGEVKLPCVGCETDIEISLSLADLFRL